MGRIRPTELQQQLVIAKIISLGRSKAAFSIWGCVISRSQQNSTFKQTQGESKDAFGDAQNDLMLAGDEIGDYKSKLDTLSAENPYRSGGEYATNQEAVLANTADAMARSAGATLQGQAARTGQNPAGAIAATEAMEDQNERNLAAQQAEAGERRIGHEADYDTGTTHMYGAIPGMREGVAGEEGRLFGNSLGVQEGAARTPSFLDTLGSSFAESIGNGVGKFLSPVKGGGN